MRSPGEKSPTFELRIVLDAAEHTYAPGAPITGTVEVRVLEACRCRCLSLSLLWRTQEEGPSQQGTPCRVQLFAGEWQTDRFLRYPFKLEAPAGPPTYHGNFLTLDWYLRAQVDLPRGLGSQRHVLEEHFTLLPAEPAQPLASPTDSWRRLLELPAPTPEGWNDTSSEFYVVLVLSVLSLFLHVALAQTLDSPVIGYSYVITFVCLVGWAFTRPAPRRETRAGFLDLWLGAQHVAPGERLPLRVKLQAGSSPAMSDHGW